MTKNRMFAAVIAVMILLTSGCASVQKPALTKDLTSLDTSQESIGVMTVRISNNNNTSYQPEIKYAFIWDSASKGDDREKHSIKVSDPYQQSEDQYNDYLISFKLPAGNYQLRELFAQSGTFPFVGTFSVPLYDEITVPENEVFYLGHINANVVEKTTDEQIAAGPLFPLIDQSITGASGGTFIVNIEDRFESDLTLIRSMFSYLENREIKNLTLPAWQKPTETEMQ